MEQVYARILIVIDDDARTIVSKRLTYSGEGFDPLRTFSNPIEFYRAIRDVKLQLIHNYPDHRVLEAIVESEKTFRFLWPEDFSVCRQN